MGLEPTTTGITIRDSTIELRPPLLLQILQKHTLACPAGLEPTTPSLEGWCSIRLSYGQIARFRRAVHPVVHRHVPGQDWSGWRDLNSRHPAPKAGALPGCATPRKSGANDTLFLACGWVAYLLQSLPSFFSRLPKCHWNSRKTALRPTPRKRARNT